ncbi:unnamed protein product [Hyaloperonospora brassicae]|uniref:Uncharacterized protein n=1 Tax=Hyaloperonospora brassicae TaxID=162125 RepID=A0AAV0TIS9_HYABA|nr:unnamed protein product [Hyaloperonospora brassicae]
MGVRPQLHLPTVREHLTKSRDEGVVSAKKHALRRHRQPPQEQLPVYAVVLPEEAQQLKDKILRTHKDKRTRFSLSHMKKVVVPPVKIPREMNSPRALSTTVAGRSVPLTRCMWNNTKRKTHHMEQIAESYPLHCTLFR